jgi:hypothetical protein
MNVSFVLRAEEEMQQKQMTFANSDVIGCAWIKQRFHLETLEHSRKEMNVLSVLSFCCSGLKLPVEGIDFCRLSVDEQAVLWR